MTIKREEAYQKFRKAIFNRIFMPGQFLTQAEIVEELGVSIGPLRYAMNRLELEGLLLVIPQRGLQIAMPNIKDIKEAFQFRSILEKEAVRHFTKNCSPALLEKLESSTRELAEKHSDSTRNGFLDSVLDLDYDLHATLIGEMNNDLIKTHYEIIFDKIRMSWVATSYTQEIVQPVMEEHLEIIHAIKSGDPERAAQAMEKHLNLSLRRIMDV